MERFTSAIFLALLTIATVVNMRPQTAAPTPVTVSVSADELSYLTTSVVGHLSVPALLRQVGRGATVGSPNATPPTSVQDAVQQIVDAVLGSLAARSSQAATDQARTTKLKGLTAAKCAQLKADAGFDVCGGAE